MNKACVFSDMGVYRYMCVCRHQYQAYQVSRLRVKSQALTLNYLELTPQCDWQIDFLIDVHCKL